MHIWGDARRAGKLSSPGKRPRRQQTPKVLSSFNTRSAITGLRLRGRPKLTPELFQDNEPLTDRGKVFADVGLGDCMWQIGRDEDGAARFCCEERHAHPERGIRRLTLHYCKDHGKLAIERTTPWGLLTIERLVREAERPGWHHDELGEIELLGAA